MDGVGRGKAFGFSGIGRALACWFLTVAVLLTQAGCRGLGDITAKMVPPDWRGNPWGPEAEEARRCGRIAPVPFSPPMTAWDDWARANLREGDILFRMGDARAACGLFPFSKISAEMAGSRYSHSGVVAWEEGGPIVYDTTKTGPRRQPFAIWILDTVGGIAVKRPRRSTRATSPARWASVVTCIADKYHLIPRSAWATTASTASS